MLVVDNVAAGRLLYRCTQSDSAHRINIKNIKEESHFLMPLLSNEFHMNL